MVFKCGGRGGFVEGVTALAYDGEIVTVHCEWMVSGREFRGEIGEVSNGGWNRGGDGRRTLGRECMMMREGNTHNGLDVLRRWDVFGLGVIGLQCLVQWGQWRRGVR